MSKPKHAALHRWGSVFQGGWEGKKCQVGKIMNVIYDSLISRGLPWLGKQSKRHKSEHNWLHCCRLAGILLGWNKNCSCHFVYFEWSVQRLCSNTFERKCITDSQINVRKSLLSRFESPAAHWRRKPNINVITVCSRLIFCLIKNTPPTRHINWIENNR